MLFILRRNKGIMNLKLNLTNPDQPDFDQVYALYQQAFPVDELYPADLLFGHFNDPNNEFWSIYDDEKWVGLVYCMTENDLTYIGFLAIAPELRGEGYGSAALAAVKEKYSTNRVCLLIEEVSPKYADYEARKKRFSFYQANGFQAAGFKIAELDVHYDFLVATGQSLTSDEYLSLINHYCGQDYAKVVNSHVID